MNSPSIKVLAFGFLISLSSWIPNADANVTITAYESNGDVVFEYAGSVNTTFLEPNYGPSYDSIYGEVAPNISLIYFGSSTLSPPNALRYYYDPVTTSPPSFGTGTTATPTGFTGSYFIITPLFVGVPTNYVSGSQISGTMTFAGQTLATLGIDKSPGSYTWNLTSLETVTLTFGAPPSVVNKKAILVRKLKNLKKKLQQAKKKKQVALIKRTEKSIAGIRKQIAAL